MHKILLVISIASTFIFADITGRWKTIDDETKEPKSIVLITKQDGIYSGKIEKIFAGDICSKCDGKYKNKSLKGVSIIQGLKHSEGNKYSGGTITDPKNDKSYKLSIIDGGETMTLRGYIGWGVASIGRTQIWHRVK